MNIDNPIWWSIIILNFFGYLTFRLGSSKKGSLSPIIEFIGGSVLLLSFILMFFKFGIIEVIILVVIFLFPITLFNEVLIFKGKLVKRPPVPKTDKEIIEGVMPGITKESKETKEYFATRFKDED